MTKTGYLEGSIFNFFHPHFHRFQNVQFLSYRDWHQNGKDHQQSIGNIVISLAASYGF